MKAADVKMLAEYLQQHLDHDPQTGEPLHFDKDCVMVDGAYPYSKSGNPTAADMKPPCIFGWLVNSSDCFISANAQRKHHLYRGS